MTQETIPCGSCQCGCGQQVSVVKQTDRRKGIIRGQPRRYVNGHQSRPARDYRIEDCGYTTPCWMWCRSRNSQTGYGVVPVPGRKSKRSAHLVYWERFRGPVPSGLQIDHLCRQRACVNPDHLEPVPQVVNIQRSGCAKLTRDDVLEVLNSPQSDRVLAQRYGVLPRAIQNIRHGVSWKNVYAEVESERARVAATNARVAAMLGFGDEDRAVATARADAAFDAQRITAPREPAREALL